MRYIVTITKEVDPANVVKEISGIVGDNLVKIQAEGFAFPILFETETELQDYRKIEEVEGVRGVIKDFKIKGARGKAVEHVKYHISLGVGRDEEWGAVIQKIVSVVGSQYVSAHPLRYLGKLILRVKGNLSDEVRARIEEIEEVLDVLGDAGVELIEPV